MANAIFSFIINSMVNVISVLLTPLVASIQLALPTAVLEACLGLVMGLGQFLSSLTGLFSFALSYFAIPAPVISLLFLYVVLKVQIWLLIETVKFFVYWWNVIKI